MENQATFRFSLRGLFVVVGFVGLGLLALKYPNEWTLFAVKLTVIASIAYAVVSALVYSDNRRLSGAAFAATALAAYLISQGEFNQLLSHEWVVYVNAILHPVDGYDWIALNDVPFGFGYLVHDLFVLVLSSIAAYVIPYLVQRGQKVQD